ncbi:carboxymuconolactone decarboxylase family protein [Marinobacterium arenosum]|uniref:carboxymuconolactone decarboxylase family protein n=1 Tax=Marinobacterium arenosum TaxID=2862496 RepID=UPI001C982186|nr:carboxymuconolactone decarboxylase family protein [Marinobacterium arenosum]MBY4675823.1 carboxymuconolactone decarboxylase family protein [Marinobacterium arenosum]
MSQRINYAKAAPNAIGGMISMENYLAECGLEPSLTELVKTRVSQINGCAYCIDMHTKDARRAGESEQRLYALSAWRETPFFNQRERAGLAWAEALTLIADGEVDDALYAQARAQFDEKELVDLTLAVTMINSWNRIALSFLPEVGSYPSFK